MSQNLASSMEGTISAVSDWPVSVTLTIVVVGE
jgi:hypothetical protein